MEIGIIGPPARRQDRGLHGADGSPRRRREAARPASASLACPTPGSTTSPRYSSRGARSTPRFRTSTSPACPRACGGAALKGSSSTGCSAWMHSSTSRAPSTNPAGRRARERHRPLPRHRDYGARTRLFRPCDPRTARRAAGVRREVGQTPDTGGGPEGAPLARRGQGGPRGRGNHCAPRRRRTSRSAGWRTSSSSPPSRSCMR